MGCNTFKKKEVISERHRGNYRRGRQKVDWGDDARRERMAEVRIAGSRGLSSPGQGRAGGGEEKEQEERKEEGKWGAPCERPIIEEMSAANSSSVPEARQPRLG